MSIRPKPGTIAWPLTADQVELIDQMFESLFSDLNNGALDITLEQLPTVARGSLLVGDTLGVVSELPVSTTVGVFLRSTGTDPAWSTLVIPNTAVTGDLFYGSASNVMDRLADVATGNALISGGVGVIPSWGKIGLTTHVTGTLGVANGGTGTATVLTAGSVVFAGASGIYTQDNGNLFWDDSNNRLGLGIPTPGYLLDVRDSSTANNPTVAHFAGSNHDRGLYLTVFTDLGFDSTVVGGNIAFDGTNWISKSTTLSYMAIGGDSVSFGAESGRVAGAVFAPAAGKAAIYASGGAAFLGAIADPGAGIFKIDGSLQITTPLAVAQGGTGRASHTAYAVICGGTTTTAAQQSIAAVGTAGHVLTSNGAGALPTFQATGLAIGNTITSATAGSVLFAGAAGVLAQDNATFFWDTTNKRLGIGNAGPAVEVDIIKTSVGAQVGFRVRNSDNTSTASDAVFIQSVGGSSGGDAYFSMSVTGATTFACGIDNSDSDKWKIAASGTLGSSDCITITTARIIAMPVYGAGTATFDANGVISSVSDERLKTNIVNFAGGLKEILGILPIAYQYQRDSGLDPKNVYVGFSAQNVMRFLPSAVGRSADVFDEAGKQLSEGRYSINDRALLAATVNAIRGLQDQIDQLRGLVGIPLLDRTVKENTGEDGIVRADPRIEVAPRIQVEPVSRRV